MPLLIQLQREPTLEQVCVLWTEWSGASREFCYIFDSFPDGSQSCQSVNPLKAGNDFQAFFPLVDATPKVLECPQQKVFFAVGSVSPGCFQSAQAKKFSQTVRAADLFSMGR